MNIRVVYTREKQPASYEKAAPLVEISAGVEDHEDPMDEARRLMQIAVATVWDALGHTVPEAVLTRLFPVRLQPGHPERGGQHAAKMYAEAPSEPSEPSEPSKPSGHEEAAKLAERDAGIIENLRKQVATKAAQQEAMAMKDMGVGFVPVKPPKEEKAPEAERAQSAPEGSLGSPEPPEEPVFKTPQEGLKLIREACDGWGVAQKGGARKTVARQALKWSTGEVEWDGDWLHLTMMQIATILGYITTAQFGANLAHGEAGERVMNGHALVDEPIEPMSLESE